MKLRIFLTLSIVLVLIFGIAAQNRISIQLNANPVAFDTETTLTVTAAEATDITLHILDQSEENVLRTIFVGHVNKGETDFVWDGTDDFDKQLDKGRYVAEVVIARYTSVKKIIILK